MYIKHPNVYLDTDDIVTNKLANYIIDHKLNIIQTPKTYYYLEIHDSNDNLIERRNATDKSMDEIKAFSNLLANKIAKTDKISLNCTIDKLN